MGQFRIDSDKTQVYDHNTRVPLLIKGPSIAAGGDLKMVASMADIAPTLLELAGASASETAGMDGTSFAAQLGGGGATDFGRTATLIEYVNSRRKDACSKPMAPPAPQNISCHWHDGGNNSFSALRIISPGLGSLMYGDFGIIMTHPSASFRAASPAFLCSGPPPHAPRGVCHMVTMGTRC